MIITTIPELVANLSTVVFPQEDISAEHELRLRRQVRKNCDALLAYIQHRMPHDAARPGHMAILCGMRKEVLELQHECGTLALLAAQPKRRSQRIARISELYEEVRGSSVLLCQQADPRYTDAVAIAM